MGAIYKLVEIESKGVTRPTAKHSPEKQTLPGAKQLFRFAEFDLLALHDECAPHSEALLKPYVINGELVAKLPDALQIRDRAAKGLDPWPTRDRRTELSHELELMAESVHVL
jgi:nicotinate phosphoribosyltransferase